MAGSIVGAAEQLAGNLLNTVQSNIGNMPSSVTSLLSPQQTAALSPSIFQTGPNDKLVTQDIYGVDSTSPINAVDQLAGNSNQNIISAFQSANGISNLSGLISSANGGISLDPSTLTSRIQGAMMGFSGSFQGLSQNTLNQAIQSPYLTSNQYPNVSTTVDGVVSSINTSNLGGAQDLINTVNSITGNPSMASYMDVGASSALMSVVMREAITQGVGGVVEALVGSATNDEVASNALQANTAYAVQQGDVGTVQQIVTSLGSGYVSSQVPNAAGQMLAAYRFPPGTTTDQYPSLYTNLTGLLDQIDPGWGTTTRNGIAVSNLAPFANMSPDAQTLFNSQEAYQTEMSVAPYYPSVGLVKQAKKQYPYMLVTPTSNQYVTTNPSYRGV